MAPPSEELQNLAKKGPIVIININGISSDAIIVSTSTIKALNLPTLTLSKAKWWIRQNLTRPETLYEFGLKNKAYSSFLSWLWSHYVKPVLQELGFVESSVSCRLPRIWWLGVGVASFLSFHAAGEYSPGSTENMFHRAISSYAPTIKALQYARERTHSTRGTSCGAHSICF